MSEPIMENETLTVNTDDKRSTIIRVVHNRENPFVQLNKQALWDENLSLKAVGLWARCMSRPNDWRFCIKELVNHCKEGRKAVYSAMQELIKAGYAYRLEYSEKTEDGKYKTSGVEYVFFEFPATDEEKKQQQEIFKKSFQHSLFGNSRYGNFRKEHLLIKNTTETESTEKNKTPPKPPQTQKTKNAAKAAVEIKSSQPKKKAAEEGFSEDVVELATKMAEALAAVNPDWLVPKSVFAFQRQVHLMLKEKRSPERILEVFLWAINDPFWMSKLSKPNPAKYLRDNFGQLAAGAMAKPPAQKTSPQQRVLDKFHHGKVYNGAECSVSEEAIGFSRGLTHKQVRFRDHGFIEQFEAMLRIFDIKA